MSGTKHPQAMIEHQLVSQYGVVLDVENLKKALGIRSASTFSRATKNSELRQKMFRMPGRRGKFAFARDVAEWLTSTAEANLVGEDDRAASQPKGDKM